MLVLKNLLYKILSYIQRDETPKILWSGGVYMHGTQTITLSEAVSLQHHGIVLVWSAYNNGSQNYDWYYHFVPKTHATNSASAGQGVDIGVMANANFSKIGTKYLYIGDTAISGHANNVSAGTTNGVTRANNYWVLRYVLGV